HVVGVGTSGASGAGFAGDLDGQGVCLLLGIGSVFVFGELACVVQKYLSCLREIASLLPVDRYLEERGSHVVAVRVSVEYLLRVFPRGRIVPVLPTHPRKTH